MELNHLAVEHVPQQHLAVDPTIRLRDHHAAKHVRLRSGAERQPRDLERVAGSYLRERLWAGG
eukprot:CAMPEP_0205929870 /NCGR_PEP_ID=MMETSP1325-20131115/25556_1 /ASSEMBLY_ACC=CAM_ASM_000708 /TAXON_ID=236786 /ORGANISM="Florenciella sp., Strain RCC1007" /LENGTH=62 /DNA_ID=CAMNT_0053299145 /DNA_START=231 /DNA_END=415 /DNA_ORIENTATION=-